MRCGAAVVLCAALAGCSSDAAPEPEPSVEDPGAFIAIGPDEISLIRILTLFRFSGDTILFFSLYDVEPSNYEEAREIAKGRDIPIRQLSQVISVREIAARPHRVVWYQSLTAEERGRAP
jgi:hypothetical protein